MIQAMINDAIYILDGDKIIIKASHTLVFPIPSARRCQQLAIGPGRDFWCAVLNRVHGVRL